MELGFMLILLSLCALAISFLAKAKWLLGYSSGMNACLISAITVASSPTWSMPALNLLMTTSPQRFMGLACEQSLLTIENFRVLMSLLLRLNGWSTHSKPSPALSKIPLAPLRKIPRSSLQVCPLRLRLGRLSPLRGCHLHLVPPRFPMILYRLPLRLCLSVDVVRRPHPMQVCQ